MIDFPLWQSCTLLGAGVVVVVVGTGEVVVVVVGGNGLVLVVVVDGDGLVLVVVVDGDGLVLVVVVDGDGLVLVVVVDGDGLVLVVVVDATTNRGPPIFGALSGPSGDPHEVIVGRKTPAAAAADQRSIWRRDKSAERAGTSRSSRRRASSSCSSASTINCSSAGIPSSRPTKFARSVMVFRPSQCCHVAAAVRLST